MGRPATDTARRLAEIATGRPAVDHTVLAGGFRHRMVRVTCGGGAQVVVRLRPEQATGVAIEAAVLARARHTVPVPQVLLSDPRGRHAGVPALVLGHVDGVRGDEVLRDARPHDALRIGEALGATAAALGAVRFDGPGLFTAPDLRTDSGHPLSGLVMPFVDRGLARVPATLLDPATATAWRALVGSAVDDLDGIDDAAVLVHADLNPKNVLLRRDGDSWALAALIDWEFAMAGPSLIDLGNVQRFAHLLPDGYATAVGTGFARAGGTLPPGWRRMAAALDAIALGEMLARGDTAPLRDDVLAVIRRAVARGSLVTTDR